jgi:hypothetical protein
MIVSYRHFSETVLLYLLGALGANFVFYNILAILALTYYLYTLLKMDMTYDRA